MSIAYTLSEKIKVYHREDWNLNKDTFIKKIRFLIYKIKCRLNPRSADIFEERLNFQLKADNLVQFLKDNKTDVLISFLVKQSIIAGLGARKIKAKIIMAERNYPARPEFQKHFIDLRNKCYSRADICVFQTNEQAKMFPECILKKSIVIPNPIKEDLPEPLSGNTKRRKCIVNYCGFKEHKNIPLLLDAFAVVSKKHPDFYLELYGYGDKEPILKKISDLRIDNKVMIMPFSKDIHSLVKDSYMFVMSSDYEGMPNALIEAMAIGLPVISTDCLGGGASAIIKDGYNGYLVPVKDLSALSSAITKLIENSDTAAEFSRRAVEIKDILSVDKISKLWLEVIG